MQASDPTLRRCTCLVYVLVMCNKNKALCGATIIVGRVPMHQLVHTTACKQSVSMHDCDTRATRHDDLVI